MLPNKVHQILPRRGLLCWGRYWIWMVKVPGEIFMAAVMISSWILFLRRRDGDCSSAVVELWRLGSGAGRWGWLVLLQGSWRLAGGLGALLRLRRTKTPDLEPWVYGVLPRPTCHSERCSATRGGPFFGSQSSLAMVLPRFFGLWFVSRLLRAAAAAEDEGGIGRWFSIFTLLGLECNFLFSRVFFAVVVAQVASLASSFGVPRVRALFVRVILSG